MGSCESAKAISDLYNDTAVAFHPGRTVAQLRNLISIVGTNHAIVFLNNRFLYNVGVKGIVYIDSWNREKPVIFYGN